MDGQDTTWRRNIAENFNRLSRVHQRYRQTDMNLSSRSLKMKQSKYCRSAKFTVSIRNGCAEKADNGAIPLETTGLVDKSKDKLHVKSEQDAFSMSGAGSSSHNSHSTNSRTSQRTYDKLAFPRQELQTLGMLGLFLIFLFSSPKQIFCLQQIPNKN